MFSFCYRVTMKQRTQIRISFEELAELLDISHDILNISVDHSRETISITVELSQVKQEYSEAQVLHMDQYKALFSSTGYLREEDYDVDYKE